MSRFGEAVDQLHDALNLERKLVDLYKQAAQEAHRHPLLEAAYLAMGERHYAHTERLHHQIVVLQKAHGDGFLRETIDSIGDAIRGAVADLPVRFVEGETRPTPETLERYETELINRYEAVLHSADPETTELLNSIIADSRKHLEKLVEMDPLK